MTRHEQREYLVSIGFALIVALIAAVVILKAGPGSGRSSNNVELLSATVTESETPEAAGALWPRRMSAGQVATRTSTPEPPIVENEVPVQSSTPSAASSAALPLRVPTPEAGPLTASTNSILPWPGERTVTSPLESLRPAGGRFAPALGGGFAGGGGASPGVATPAPEATEPAESVASEQTVQRARIEGGHVTSATAATAESAAPPPDNPAPLSTELATVFEELAPSSPALVPVVLSSPEPFGGAAIEQVVAVESFAAPASVESIVASAAETLVQAQFDLPGADDDLAVAAAPVADTPVLNPEPTTLILLGTGLGLTARYARRRRAPRAQL